MEETLGKVGRGRAGCQGEQGQKTAEFLSDD
jgi:hypothetical protein